MDSITSAKICAGSRSARNAGSQAKDWVGKPIAAALHLDLDSKADKAKIKGALKIWLENNMFKEVEGEDAKRNKRIFIEVGVWAS